MEIENDLKYLNINEVMEMLDIGKSMAYELKDSLKVQKILRRPIKAKKNRGILYLQDDIIFLKEFYEKAKSKKVIVLLNHKGGVAKSCSTAAIGHILAKKGEKVLLIDTDSQSNLTSIFEKEDRYELTLYNLFENPGIDVNDVIYKTHIPNLDIIPGNIRIAEIGLMEGVGAKSLKRPVDEIGGYDYILIDTPPSISIFTSMCLNVATDVLIPFELSAFSVDGIYGISKAIEKAKLTNETVNVLGLFATKVRPDTIANRVIRDSLPENMHFFSTEIPYSTIVEQAVISRQTILEFKEDSKPAISYQELVEEVFYAQ